MKISGGCHCGAIRYEAEVDPDQVSICNCTDCQQLSGSAWRVNVPAPAATFKLLSGTPQAYIKTADSGAKRMQAFCSNCATQLWAQAPENTPTYNLRVGTIDQRGQLKPQRQIWRNSALEWAQDISGVPARDGN